MSNLAHALVRDPDTSSLMCACGSEWNWIVEECSFLAPFPGTPVSEHRDYQIEVEQWDAAYYECRKGHAFCGRH